MKKNPRVMISLLGLSLILLWGCGGGGSGPGSPGSSGSDDTGVEVTATVTGRYLDQDTFSVDVVRNPDCDGDPTTNDPEPFTTHGTTFNISARLLNQNSTGARPLVIESYTVRYFVSQDSLGGPPIETATYFDTISIPVPTGANISTLEASGILVDLVRKTAYLRDMQSGQYTSSGSLINNYTAVFVFSGQNDLGEKFEFQASTNFEIGNFDYCEQ